MKLFKQNGIEFEPFYRTLPNLADNTEYSQAREFADNYRLGGILNKYSHFMNSLLELESELAHTDNLADFPRILRAALKKIINLKSAEIFILNSEKEFIPLTDNELTESWLVLKQINSSGLLNAIFSSGNAVLLPENESYFKENSRLNYLIYPIVSGAERKGVLIIQTAIASFSQRSIEDRFFRIMVSRIFSKIEALLQRLELKETYNELQAYQSKFKNEYKLSAIGELTSEIVENILEPLQVIVSSADLLISETDEEKSEILGLIKNKSKAIETSIKRISRFSSRNNMKDEFVSCDLNNLIREFFTIIESNFKRKNYEFLLDLDENLPPVLSNPEYIKQILTNLFILLNSSMKNAGGVWLQTKHVEGAVALKIYSSDFLQDLSIGSRKSSQNNYLKIVESLLKKHKGAVKYDSQKLTGTSILIYFPLRRKEI